MWSDELDHPRLAPEKYPDLPLGWAKFWVKMTVAMHQGHTCSPLPVHNTPVLCHNWLQDDAIDNAQESDWSIQSSKHWLDAQLSGYMTTQLPEDESADCQQNLWAPLRTLSTANILWVPWVSLYLGYVFCLTGWILQDDSELWWSHGLLSACLLIGHSRWRRAPKCRLMQ